MACQKKYVARLFVRWTGVVLAATASWTLASDKAMQSPAPSEVPIGGEQLQVEILAEGLEYPWSLVALPEGGFLVTELTGNIRRMAADGALSEPLQAVPEVLVGGQGGMLDISLHPDFERNQLVYFSYTWGTVDANATRLARARLDGDKLVDLQVLFTAEPPKAATFHFGGRMTWLPDDTLVLAVGEGNKYMDQAQQLDNHLGTLVRLNADGTVPSDNPFVGREDAMPEIWSYGHRNPQGIVWDDEAGILYQNEHGPRGGDEVNIIEPGKNYGWPEISYGINYDGSILTEYTEKPGMEQPILYFDPSIAPGGMAQVRGEMFADWNGDLLIAALSGMELRRVDMENGEIVGQQRLLTDQGYRIRHVRMGLDGAIYVLTDANPGPIFRLTPAP